MPNWKLWTPDATFAEVERLGPDAAVLSCVYQIPVISNRDLCFYEVQLSDVEMASLLPAEYSVPGARGAVAMSVPHPLCPARRNTVRSRLLIAVTLFTPTPGGCTVTSIQQ